MKSIDYTNGTEGQKIWALNHNIQENANKVERMVQKVTKLAIKSYILILGIYRKCQHTIGTTAAGK
jgi:hypothetical protein